MGVRYSRVRVRSSNSELIFPFEADFLLLFHAFLGLIFSMAHFCMAPRHDYL